MSAMPVVGGELSTLSFSRLLREAKRGHMDQFITPYESILECFLLKSSLSGTLITLVGPGARYASESVVIVAGD